MAPSQPLSACRHGLSEVAACGVIDTHVQGRGPSVAGRGYGNRTRRKDAQKPHPVMSDCLGQSSKPPAWKSVLSYLARNVDKAIHLVLYIFTDENGFHFKFILLSQPVWGGSKIVCNGSTAEWFKVCAEMWDKYFPTPLSWAKNCHAKWQAYIPAQCVEALGP